MRSPTRPVRDRPGRRVPVTGVTAADILGRDTPESGNVTDVPATR